MTSAGIQLDQAPNNLFDQIRDLQERLAELERQAHAGPKIQVQRTSIGTQRVDWLSDGDLAVDGSIYSHKLAMATMASIYLGLPAIKAFWPMSATGGYNVATINDLSGNGLHLTNSGGSLAWINNTQDPSRKVICVGLDGAADYLYRADDATFRVDGVETNILSYNRGLTLGAWIKANTVGTTSKTIMAQWDRGTNQRAFRFHIDTSSHIAGILSDDGIANTDSLAAVPTVTTDRWTFACLQWNSNTDTLRIWHDDTVTEAASTTVDLHNSTAVFTLGASLVSAAPESYFDGQLALAFFCGANIHDDTINRLYQQTKTYFRPYDLNG